MLRMVPLPRCAGEECARSFRHNHTKEHPVEYDLQLVKVGKTYDNSMPAVVDFNLDVEKGEFIGFLGPSGCGKTTTLRMIAGFEAITTGVVSIRGRRINDLPPERRPTSMIFQNYALFPHMSVRRNVGYGLEVKRMPKAERDAKVERILATLDLLDIADMRPDRLSGGQRQRIALARSIVVEPDILLLDEPLGALDANLRKKIQAELKLLQRDLGITFVFVTHAQSEALTLSDRIVVMNKGRIEQISPPYELYTRPKTPFVAQFIGRNAIFPGTLATACDGIGTVATEFGLFQGSLHTQVPVGGKANVVVPSLAFDVRPAADAAPLGNALGGTIERRDVIGNVVHLGVTLAKGENVLLEKHVGKVDRNTLSPGADVWITWNAAEATVIAA
jgi:putative spermidine/putrescine transport system ATP-binding protein/spermidine/putrescine transport system ATP-binding protein